MLCPISVPLRIDMASFRYRSDRRQARVRRNGYPDETKSFKTRLEAEKWARSVETDMDRGQFASIDEAQRSTLGDLIKRYLSEVTPQMKGASEDTIRLKAIMRKPIARWSMANLSAARIGGAVTCGSRRSAREHSSGNWHICRPSSTTLAGNGESTYSTRCRWSASHKARKHGHGF